MNQNDFLYVVDTKKSFEAAVISVLQAVEKNGWALFNIYDVQERLAAKGFKQDKLKIIEICSAKYANAFLNKNRFVSIFMPCKINVILEKNKVKIVGMKPSIMSQFFTEIPFDESQEFEKTVQEIIDNAAI